MNRTFRRSKPALILDVMLMPAFVVWALVMHVWDGIQELADDLRGYPARRVEDWRKSYWRWWG